MVANISSCTKPRNNMSLRLIVRDQVCLIEIRTHIGHSRGNRHKELCFTRSHRSLVVYISKIRQSIHSMCLILEDLTQVLPKIHIQLVSLVDPRVAREKVTKSQRRRVRAVCLPLRLLFSSQTSIMDQTPRIVIIKMRSSQQQTPIATGTRVTL